MLVAPVNDFSRARVKQETGASVDYVYNNLGKQHRSISLNKQFLLLIKDNNILLCATVKIIVPITFKTKKIVHVEYQIPRDTLQEPMLHRIVANFFELNDIFEFYHQE